MAQVRANGVDFHVQRLMPHRQAQVEPQTVVFVHGLVIDNMSTFYFTLANPVAHAGDEAILYDLRGHGRSSRPSSGYTFDDILADLDALLDALGIDHPVHLVGNSFGGTLALGFAMWCPQRVASAVVIDANYAVEGLALAEPKMREDEVRAWLTNPTAGLKLQAIGRAVDALANHTTMIADMKAAESRPWLAEQMGMISCPVLAIYGEDSDIADRAQHLDRLIPSCEMVVLPGCTHFVIMDGAQRLTGLVLDWLARQRSLASAAGGAR